MRALVTGAAGFIGSTLVDALLAAGIPTVGVDSFEDYYSSDIKRANLADAQKTGLFQLHHANLLNCDLQPLLEGVDTVYHLAATPGVRASWGETFDSYVQNNVRATERLLYACQDLPLKRFVYASSSSVYGDSKDLPLREISRPQPYSPYGVTKLAGEHLCMAYWRNFKVPVVALRFFTVYGPRQRPDMAFNRFIRAAIVGDPITMYGDGEQTRDFTFVADTVKALVQAGTVAGIEGQILNVGGGSCVTVRQTLQIIERVVGRPLQIDRRPSQKGDVRDTLADTSSIREALGFVPTTTIEEGLAAEAAWIQNALEPRAQASTRA